MYSATLILSISSSFSSFAGWCEERSGDLTVRGGGLIEDARSAGIVTAPGNWGGEPREVDVAVAIDESAHDGLILHIEDPQGKRLRRHEDVEHGVPDHLGTIEPPQVCVAPIVVGGRVVNLVYVQAVSDGAYGDAAIEGLRRLADGASLAYVRLIATNKAKSLRE